MTGWLDELTSTFSVDQAFADLLADSPHTAKIAELIVWNEWRNRNIQSYINFLPQLAAKRFKRDLVDLASDQSASLILATNRDLSLPLFLAVRGLPTDGLFFIRRSLEHLAVLSHVWKHPIRVQALEDPDSDMYRNAFQLGPPSYRGGHIQWRFSALQLLGAEASRLYRELSALTAHGGPNAVAATSSSLVSCTLVSRHTLDDSYEGAISVVVESTKIIQANLSALFRHYMRDKGLSDDEVERANSEAFGLLRTSGDEDGGNSMSASIRSILAGIP